MHLRLNCFKKIVTVKNKRIIIDEIFKPFIYPLLEEVMPLIKPEVKHATIKEAIFKYLIVLLLIISK